MPSKNVTAPARSALAALLLALAAVLSSCGSALAEGELVVTDHDSKFRFMVGGRERDGLMHLPASYDGTKPCSLLFALHGGNQDAAFFSGMGFNRLADRLDFIVVYPNGIGRRWDSGNDVALFLGLTKALAERYAIDPRRVYATGHSAGAIEVYELASLAPGLFAAIAPVAGTVIAGSLTGDEVPTSVLAIHAKDDPEVPFSGVDNWGITPFSGSIDVWRRINGGASGKGAPFPDWLPVPERAREGGGTTFLRAHGVTGTLWAGEGVDTAAIVQDAGGHVWPARATEFVMDFFYNHPARPARVEIDAGALPIAVRAQDPITLRAVASPEAVIEKVTFFANDTTVGEATRYPYEISWKPVTVGLNNLRAEAVTKTGETVKSTFERFTLASAPSREGMRGQSAASIIAPLSCRSSSNEAADIEAPCAIDRDFFTRWSSGWTDDEWLVVDLGSPRAVSGVTIFWEIAWGREYAIELSVDGKAWQREVSVSEGEGGVECHPFEATRARYVRFRGIKRGTEWGYSFWEFLVHGD